MKERVKKPLTVALAAVLVFMALFPVPVGARSLDRARFQEANANPALAAPLIIGTALAACGVYVAGYDMAAYSSNRETISGQFVQFCADNLYHEDIDAATAAIQSAVTPGGAVDMGVLSSLGILGLIPAFSEGLINTNQAINGASTLDSMQGVLNIGNHQFAYASGVPAIVAEQAANGIGKAQSAGYTDLVAMSVATASNGNVTYQLYYTDAATMTANLYESSAGGVDASQLRLNMTGKVVTLICLNTGSYSSSTANITSNNTTSISVNGMRDSSTAATIDRYWYVFEGVDYPITGYDVSSGMVSNAAAVVNGAIAANTSAYPTTQVQPFEPTAEQLAAGYDLSAILEAINGNTGTIESVAAQIASIAGLLSPVAGIAANVQSIKDAWTNTSTAQTTPFPWLDALWDSLFGILGATPLPDLLSPITLGVQAVQSWIGDTDFPTIMQTVIDGVQAIPDGIRNVGDEVLEGLGAIPGAIGTASDVIVGGLEGVLDATLGLAGDIADAIGLDAVADALIGPVQGILEAVQEVNNPNLREGSGVALSEGAKAQFDAKLLEKAPFCYVKRAQAVGESVAANFGGAASFYVEFPFPMMQEPLRVDATPFFAESWGGFTIAQWIRMLLTSVLCAGFIVVAIKVAMRTVGTGAGD